MATNHFNVYYSFLHRNESPYLADLYRVFRQEDGGPWDAIAEHPAGKVGDPVLVTGMDVVDNCNITYTYKVSAYNNQGEVYCINPLVSGVNFPCPTPSRTQTSTPTTPTATPTRTQTKTPSNTPSKTASNTPTQTPTNTQTPTLTPTATQTQTQTVTNTQTQTQTQSVTATSTSTQTPSQTVTNTQTQTQTSTLTQTPTVTNTSTQTPTVTKTLTQTPTVTPSHTQTPTITPSHTQTQTVTPSQTHTPTQTSSITPSQTQTQSVTATQTQTQTVTPSHTQTQTVTPSHTQTQTQTQTNTPTHTQTVTQTPSQTQSQTVTPSHTQTPTVTPSHTQTQTVTPSHTPSPTVGADWEVVDLTFSGSENSNTFNSQSIDGYTDLDVRASAFSWESSSEGSYAYSWYSFNAENTVYRATTRTGFRFFGVDNPSDVQGNVDMTSFDTSNPNNILPYSVNDGTASSSSSLKLIDFGLLQCQSSSLDSCVENNSWTRVDFAAKDDYFMKVPQDHLIYIKLQDGAGQDVNIGDYPNINFKITGVWQ
jgi:hypothetical protein